MKHYLRHRNAGQALLIVILIATVLVTIGLSVLYNSTQEAQLARVEEDAQKAFAAAEAGLQAALERNSTDLSDLDFAGVASLNAEFITDATTTFITPRISKDSQYTFYLSSYDEDLKSVTGAAYDGTISITVSDPTGTYCTSEDTQFAVELTFADMTDGSETAYRRLIDPCAIVDGTEQEWTFGTEYTLSSESLSAHIVFIRIIGESGSFGGAKLILTRSGGNWPLQGKTVIAIATTTTGIEKKLKLFQSYPQISADLMVTSF
ncbi:MAG: hypothetical protein UZ21_OP11001001005 [Microgenomates bacterium OLB22]|nr:MAG: hypothetical protein UZ21_OP11001001005 [Microgenomates bacterium OLB22]